MCARRLEEPMKVVIEVVVDEVADAVPLIREVATKIKRGGGIASGQIVSYCLGDYRVTLLDESIDVVNSNVSIGE
jgi:hypothetical protein